MPRAARNPMTLRRKWNSPNQINLKEKEKEQRKAKKNNEMEIKIGLLLSSAFLAGPSDCADRRDGYGTVARTTPPDHHLIIIQE